MVVTSFALFRLTHPWGSPSLTWSPQRWPDFVGRSFYFVGRRPNGLPWGEDLGENKT